MLRKLFRTLCINENVELLSRGIKLVRTFQGDSILRIGPLNKSNKGKYFFAITYVRENKTTMLYNSCQKFQIREKFYIRFLLLL